MPQYSALCDTDARERAALGESLRPGRERRDGPEARRPPRRNRRRPRRRSAPWLPLALFALAAAGFVLPDLRLNIVAAFGGFGDEIVGRASVIDGDTLDINGTRIRLHGMDAPESRQSCKVLGRWSRCGQRASGALARKIGGRPVACEPRDRDRYNRIVAVCRVDGEDLNAWMVAQGWALAYRRYSLAYVQEEGAASASGRGIWQGDFVAPWDWRRGKRL